MCNYGPVQFSSLEFVRHTNVPGDWSVCQEDVIRNSVCKMYPLYARLSQQFTITIGQSFCFDLFRNDNESVIGEGNSLCIYLI